MKVLYATRLFSGLEASVASRTWNPTGVPTIYRLIEALASVPGRVSVVLCAKDGHTMLNDLRDMQIDFVGLPCRVQIMAATPHASGPFTRALREVRHAVGIVRSILRERPSLIYLDHGNVWTAGILARVLKTPVVFRVMGVYPAMRTALESPKIANRILRWCYKAPYAAVICTQDGSGVEPWLKTALSQETPVHTLLNGVDPVTLSGDQHPAVSEIRSDATVVTFLGKLEPAKGITEFTDAFLAAYRKNRGLHALIVGSGSLSDATRDKFQAADASGALTLLQRLPHDQVLNALSRSDIYVSLNKYGNLSNANLEAMRVGAAIIMPDAQPDLGIDLATRDIVPPGSAIRIDPVCKIPEIADAILELAADPDKRVSLSSDIRQLAQSRLDTWESRIKREVDILEQVSGHAD